MGYLYEFGNKGIGNYFRKIGSVQLGSVRGPQALAHLCLIGRPPLDVGTHFADYGGPEGQMIRWKKHLNKKITTSIKKAKY